MTTRHLVDPELEAFLEGPRLDISAETLAAAREGIKTMFAAMAEVDPTVKVVERVVPGPAGAPDVKVLIYTPPGPAKTWPGFFHVHGGGFILGDAAMGAARCQQRAKELDCVVVSVDYRLAPETPYPGPVEDCYAGLKWMAENAKSLGVDPDRIVIGGESAGGGLAAALALLARDRGGPKIAFQLLIYPMLDHRTATDADPYNNPMAGEFVWTHPANRFGWSAMLGSIDPSGAVPHHCSPARAETLAGLPPTFIAVGTLDLFVDEDMEYAARLARDGVPVELHVYPGAFHAFDAVVTATVAQQFQADCARALKRAMAA